MDLNLIRTLCEKRKGGISGLAKSIGMTVQNLHRCIRENKIQAQDLEKICCVLNVPITVFFNSLESRLPDSPSTDTDNQIAEIKNRLVGEHLTEKISDAEHMEVQDDTIPLLKMKVELLQKLLDEKERYIALLERNQED